MTNASDEIGRGLALVRRRISQLGVLKALLLGAAVAGGALLALMLADHLYAFRMLTRLLLLGAAALAVAAVAGRHLLRARAHPPSDVEVALYVESRRPELQGALLAAVEFGSAQAAGSAIRSYIVDVLMEEAARKLLLADIGRLVRLGRVRSQAAACLAVLLLVGLNAAIFQDYFARQSRRVLAPWIAPEGTGLDGSGGRQRARREGFLTDDLKAPLQFRVSPQNVEAPEGGRIEVTAELSRSPLGAPVLLCYRSQGGAFQQLPMRDVQRVYEYARALEDITQPIEYYVAVGADTSDHYFISVQRRLRVERFELTYTYPDYLKRPPRKIESQAGDVSAVEGSQVAVRLKTNHAPSAGSLRLTAGGTVPMAVGPEGATGVIRITANDTYHYLLRDEKGKELRSDTMFFIEAVPDNPPRLEVVGPNIDLTVHPVSEVTVTVKVTEDQALADVRLHYEVLRDAGDGKTKTQAYVKSLMPKHWTDAVSEAQAVCVLELEGFQPCLRDGDSILYHVEAEDRKGQKAVSDMFSVTVVDFSLCALHPAPHANVKKIVIAPLMKFIAAAWKLEQQRATLSRNAFLGNSKAIAEKLKHPETGKVINFFHKTGDATGVENDPVTAEAYKHTVAAHGLLDQGEPGKAVVELQLVYGTLTRTRDVEPEVTYSGSVAQFATTTGILEPSMGIAKLIAHMNMGDPDEAPPPPEPILVDVAYARKLGRQDMEKIAEVRKDIAKIRRQVKEIGEGEARDAPKLAMASQPQEGDGQPKARRTPQADKAGDQNPQDQKGQPPEARPDEKKGAGGEPKGGEPGKADREKEPGEKGDNGKAAGDQPRPQKPAGGEPGPDQMKQRAEDTAAATEKLADRLHGQLAARDSKEIREGLNDLRAAASRLRRATEEFNRKQISPGLTEAREADRLLGKADEALGNAEQKTLNEMLADATRQAYQLTDRQGRVQAAIDELRKHDDRYKQAVKSGRDDRVAEEKARREGVVAALRALGEEAKGFQGQLARTHEAVKRAGEPAVGQFTEEAVKVMNRQDLPQDMVDSAMDVRQGNLASARKAQDGAAQALQQTLDALNNATDVLSGTKAGAIERASRIAQKVKKEAKDLLAQEDGKVKDEGKGEEKKPSGPDTTKGAGEKRSEPGKGGDQKAEPGKGADRDQPRRPGDKKAPGEKGEVVAHSTQDQDVAQLWSDLRVLVRQLRALDIVPQNAVDILDRTSQSQEEFRRMFSRLRQQDVVAFVGVVSEVADRVASGLEKARAERKLQTGLREECPPVYRRLVGMYYKALSGGEQEPGR